jgi:hypothetical protein
MTSKTTFSKTNLSVATALLAVLAFSLPFATHAATAKVKKTVDKTCIQTAVGVREEAIIEAFETYYTSLTEALTDRKTALNEAWGMEEGGNRKAAIKDVWTDWKSDKKAAHAELKSDKKAAWEKFKSTVKTSCKVTLPKDEELEKDTAGTLSL